MTSVPTNLELRTPDGAAASLGDVLTQPLTIVQLVRYFGCLPCQDWLVALDQQAHRLAEQGIAVAAIGGTADYQATWLREEKGVRMPLLLDPDHQVREHVDAMKKLVGRLASPRGMASYASALANGYRVQKPTRDAMRSPGVIVLDQTGKVRYRHIGTRLGDYPDLDELMADTARLV